MPMSSPNQETKIRILSICFFAGSDLHKKYSKEIVSIVHDILDSDYDDYLVFTGGYGGMMNLIAKEFKKQRKNKNVQLIGITCDAYEIEIDDDPLREDNQNVFSNHNDVIIQTESLPDRINAMIELADVFVVLPGKQGTLNEMITTYEAYHHPVELLREKKNAKLLIHDYWRPLWHQRSRMSKLLLPFQKKINLRHLQNISFFNKGNFKERLANGANLLAVKNNSHTEKPDATKGLPGDKGIELYFENLKEEIEIVVFGDTYDHKVRERFAENILAIDFGYFIDKQERDGGFMSYSTTTYQDLLKKFFSDFNSIMFYSKPNEFLIANIGNRNQRERENLELFKDEKIPQEDACREPSEFKNWENFLRSKSYGQTLIWRGIGNSLSGNKKFNLSIFYLFDCKLPSRKIERIKLATDNFLANVTAKKMEELFLEKEFELEKQATRAAIADIINRNYAHHIGSHVSHRASLEKILERLSLTIDKIQSEQLASIAKMRQRLETYKDERSEFIASVTSVSSSQSFNFYTDVIRPFVENTLVIDNIAANEGIRYYKKYDKNKLDETDFKVDDKTLSQLVIRVFIEKSLTEVRNRNYDYKQFREDLRDTPKEYLEQRVVYYNDKDKLCKLYDSVSIPYYLKHTVSVNEVNPTFYEDAEPLLNDIQVNLPGGLGKHTIYSLLENYIRNTAKHAYKPEHAGKPVEIILKLSPVITKEGIQNQDDKILFEITDNISIANKSDDSLTTVVSKMNGRIQSDLIKKEGMGIADMKISACLLAEKELTETNLKQNITAIESDTHLGYKMVLSRPKHVALIGCCESSAKPAEGYFPYKDLAAYKVDAKKNFQFAILDKSLEAKIGESKNILPLRLFVLGENVAESRRYKPVSKVEPGKESLLEWCWKNWIEFKANGDKVRLSVFFQQDAGEKPTHDWNADKEKFVIKDKAVMQVLSNADKIIIKPYLKELVYDRHAVLIQSNNKIKFNSGNFWELLDKNTADFDILNSTDVSQKPFTIPFEMMDAALTNVLVIDERVAEMAHHKMTDDKFKPLITSGGFKKVDATQNATLFDVCWAAGIHIATHINYKGNNHLVSNRVKDDKPEYKINHFLEVKFEERENKVITISSKVNFTEKLVLS